MKVNLKVSLLLDAHIQYNSGGLISSLGPVEINNPFLTCLFAHGHGLY